MRVATGIVGRDEAVGLAVGAVDDQYIQQRLQIHHHHHHLATRCVP